MNLEEKVHAAKQNNEACEILIKEYSRFISSEAAKISGKFVSEHDDEMSVAMIAFCEAIQKYEKDKGNFLSFASMIIKNRLIDYIRSEKRSSAAVPFSSLAQTDKDNEQTEFEAEASDDISFRRDIRCEIEELTEELKNYNISFNELSKVSPKSKKTKAVCFEAIGFVAGSPLLTADFKKSGVLPIKAILGKVNANRKVIERHRKYIVAGIIILTGDYGYIAEYFGTAKGAKK